MKAMLISKIVPFIIGFAVLTSYSGQWEVFTCKNDVRDIALSGNTLWAATTGGVVAWNLGDNSYKSYTTADGLISCDINQVAIDKKGRPWVATKWPAGLFVYENHAWEQINVGGADNVIEDKIISGLEVDQLGNVWVYIKYDKYSLKKIKFSNGSEFVGKWRSKIHNKFYIFALAHIALDRRGNPWMAYFDDRYGDDIYGVVCNDTIYNTLDGLADENVGKDLRISLFNALGRTIYVYTTEMKMKNGIFTFPISGLSLLSGGVYHVKIKNERDFEYHGSVPIIQ